MKVMVVDATHGGITLSEEFWARGDEVTCVDVYGTLPKKAWKEYSEKFRVERELPAPSRYDLIVKPVHFPLDPFRGVEERVITHHQAVRLLLYDRIKFPVVEITGSFGKTTSALCAISLLRRRFSILSLTSRGIRFQSGAKEEVLLEGASTTPANIIKAVKLARERPDLAIFEVSLGGTGLADLGIIKNVYENYPIARGTSSALEAKLSMVKDRKKGSTVLVNADDEKLSDLTGVQFFSPSGRDCQVKAVNARVHTDGIEFTMVLKGFKSRRGRLNGVRGVRSLPGPIGKQQIENMLVGATIASYFHWEETDIVFGAEPFEKRMVLDSFDPPRVLNKSPSLSAGSIQASIRDYLELFPPNRLEIGGKLKTTCGSVNPKQVASILSSSPFLEIVLFGELGHALRPFTGKRIVKRRRTAPALVLERG